MPSKINVKSWAQFERRVRERVPDLLVELPSFDDAILVAGCQRSGTTAICRILKEALGMPDFRLTKDDELDAALILSGAATSDWSGRHCFQTTYLNDRVAEYDQHDNYKLVWLLRNPQAVVQSMLNNWRYGALVRLFNRCGSNELDVEEKRTFERFGSLPFSRLKISSLSYNAKTAQTAQVSEGLGPDRLFVVDYDDLVDEPEKFMPALFDFCNVAFDEKFLGALKRSKISGKKLLSDRETDYIDSLCGPVYAQARQSIRDVG